MFDNPLFIQALEEEFNKRFDEDVAELEAGEQYDFSIKHNKKMQKLIKRQRKPYFKLISTAGRRIACVSAAIVILSASVLSVSAIRKPLFSFVSSIFSDHTVISAESGTNLDSPETIENEYYISELPDGFILKNETKTSVSVEALYTKDDSFILFTQTTLKNYKESYDNEHSSLTAFTDDNGQEYLYVSTGNETTIIWNGGHYVFTISGNLNKESAMKLCKSIKMK